MLHGFLPSKMCFKRAKCYFKSKRKTALFIHQGCLWNKKRNLAKIMMISTMILSDNNAQHYLVMSHHGDTKHYCPLQLSYVSTVSLPLTRLNTKSGHFTINQKPRNIIQDTQDKVFLQRRDSKLAVCLVWRHQANSINSSE